MLPQHQETAFEVAPPVGVEDEEKDQCLDTYTPWGSMKERGFTPMHMAMQTIAPLESIRHLLQVLDVRNVCTQRDDMDGMTPLHVGVKHYGYHSVAIQTLVRACPEASQIVDHAGKLPLHYCMQHAEVVSNGALRAVLDAHGPAAEAMDEMGRTPLHLGLIHGAKDEAIQTLLQHHPATVSKKYKDWTPLHWAMGCSATATVVTAILEASSSQESAVLAPDGDGKNALHVAMGMGATSEAIRVLLDACPKAAQVRDHDGWYPLYHGIRYKAPQEARRLVQEAFPEAVEVIDGIGDGGHRKPYELDLGPRGSRTVRKGYRVKD